MPISFQEIQNNIDQSIVSRVIRTIDGKLSDPTYAREWMCNSDTNPTYRFAIPGSVTDYEKKAIINTYMNVGWGTVEVKNSSENGERPGMVGVVLKQHAE